MMFIERAEIPVKEMISEQVPGAFKEKKKTATKKAPSKKATTPKKK